MTNGWCWAASGEMVMDSLGVDVELCKQAVRRHGTAKCCDGQKPQCCFDGGFPDFAYYGFTYCRTSNTALSWEEIKIQISCKKRPVVFSWHYAGNGGHMMVIVGYVENEYGKTVIVDDPQYEQPTELTYTYAYYVEKYGSHTHWDDFYDVALR